MHICERFELPVGFRARPFAGPDDYPAMAAILTEHHLRQGEPERVSAEQIASNYRHLDDCEPDLDIFVVETDAGDPIGYGRTMYDDLESGGRDCMVFAPTMTAHLGEELFHAIADAAEAHTGKYVVDPDRTRLRAWARHPGPGVAAEGEAAWLESRGYVATEWTASLVRPDLDDIPERALPDGVEVRPVTDDQLRTIVGAHLEAFRGEWDFTEPTESDFVWIIDDPYRDRTLWQVAWAGDEVVGQVKPFINHDENAERGYLRGYAEYISTHRDWRNRGIAGALLARSLRALADRGMTEAALGVDTNNPGGAFQLYRSLGFELRAYTAVYTRPVTLAAPADGAARSGAGRVVAVRDAQLGDAPAVADTHATAWRVAYRGVLPDEVLDDPGMLPSRLEHWSRRLADGPPPGAGDPRNRIQVGLLDGRVVAFGHCGLEAHPPADPTDDRRGQIYAFYAQPAVWGSGVADELMIACLDELRSRGFRRAVLWVLADNPRAHRFYRRHGWRPTGASDQFTWSPAPSVPTLREPVTEVQFAIDLPGPEPAES